MAIFGVVEELQLDGRVATMGELLRQLIVWQKKSLFCHRKILKFFHGWRGITVLFHNLIVAMVYNIIVFCCFLKFGYSFMTDEFFCDEIRTASSAIPSPTSVTLPLLRP